MKSPSDPRDEKLLQDLLWIAMHEFMEQYGFERMVQVVAAGIVAGADIKDQPLEPQPVVKTSTVKEPLTPGPRTDDKIYSPFADYDDRHIGNWSGNHPFKS